MQFMRSHGIALTRENYIHHAYAGNRPDELSAEEEAQLPERFRKKAFVPPKKR